jgi:tripartite-type tricarboxylate transporter receptor subunit TctC
MSTLIGTRRAAAAAILLLAGSLAGMPAQAADDYPSRPITVVIPFAAGGPTDLVARIVTARMMKLLGQPLVVDNRAGAGGAVGTAQVARANPDGYTLIVGNTGSHATAPLANRAGTYDPVKDFVPVAMLGVSNYVLICNPKFPPQNIQDLLTYAREHPGKLSYGSAGIGSQIHFIGEDLKRRTKIDIVHVPYKGSGPLRSDVLSGTIDCTFDTAAKQYIDSGMVRAFVVMSDKRDAFYPDVPTMAEAGVKDFNLSSWQGLMAPRGTPAAIVDKLNKAANHVLNQPETKIEFERLGFHVVSGPPSELGKVVVRDAKLYREVLNAAGIVLQ